MVDQLMERLHALVGAEGACKEVSFDLDGLCNQLLGEDLLSIEFLKRRLILTGPKSTGKSVIKAILNGHPLQSKLTQKTPPKTPFQQ